MESLKHIIKDVLGSLDKKRGGGNNSGIASILEKILSKKRMRHIQIRSFKDGILNIDAESSSEIFYLNLKKEAIRRQLNKLPQFQNKKRDKIKIYFNLSNRTDR